ncbi:MAG TPA: dethiobiotin synthase [Planctomycetes bacterium]|nr:dethiobiotin synthase [Planctomycetota bacterium]HIL38355.1 dethiobiotin synthase [Planctomycetota bacterium]
MLSIQEQLADELTQLERTHQRRETISAPQHGDWFTNDLFGLSQDPHVIARAKAALDQYGAGSRASRALGGDSPLHMEAEALVADWLGAPRALLFPSGWQACAGVLGALVGRGDVIFCDRMLHASLIDGARLTRARRVITPHLDLAALENALRQSKGARRRLIATEGVFSMDGTAPNLVRLSELAVEYDAWLLIDEAHSAGVLGPKGRGAWAAACEEGALDANLVSRIVTGGKALGCAGAFVLGSSELRALMLTKARSFLFTTAPSPAVTGALCGAIERIQELDQERIQLRTQARHLAQELDLPTPAGAIVPIPIGSSERAMEVALKLRDQGIQVRAVRPPTVPHGESRIRVVLHSNQTTTQIDQLVEALRNLDWTPNSTPKKQASAARALWVLGTDTDVGKTVASAGLLHALQTLGRCGYCKPVQTGSQDPLGSDTNEVQRLAPEVLVCAPAIELPLPASPHEAAAAVETRIDLLQLNGWLNEQLRKQTSGVLVVEPAGGLHVPLTTEVLTSDWCAQRGEDLVLVARSGLGTLNHTLLTMEALITRNLHPRALILVGTPHDSNRRTLVERVGCPVVELPLLEPLTSDSIKAWALSSGMPEILKPLFP